MSEESYYRDRTVFSNGDFPDIDLGRISYEFLDIITVATVDQLNLGTRVLDPAYSGTLDTNFSSGTADVYSTDVIYALPLPAVAVFAQVGICRIDPGVSGGLTKFAIFENDTATAKIAPDPATGSIYLSDSGVRSTKDEQWRHFYRLIYPPVGTAFIVPHVRILQPATSSSYLDAFQVQTLPVEQTTLEVRNLLKDPSLETYSLTATSATWTVGAGTTTRRGVGSSGQITRVGNGANASDDIVASAFFTDGGGDGFGTAIPVTAGQVYSYGYWVYTGANSRRATAKIRWHASNNALLSSSEGTSVTIASSASWTLVTVSGTAPVGATGAVVEVTVRTQSGAAVANEITRVDDFILSPTAAPLDYFDGTFDGAYWVGEPNLSQSAFVIDGYRDPGVIKPLPRPDRLNLCTNPIGPDSGITFSTSSGTDSTLIDEFEIGETYVASMFVSSSDLEMDIALTCGEVKSQGTRKTVVRNGDWARIWVVFTATDVFQNLTVTTTNPGSTWTKKHILVEKGDTVWDFFDGTYGENYLWEQGGIPHQTRSYFYEDRIKRNYLLKKILKDNVPIGIEIADPEFAVYRPVVVNDPYGFYGYGYGPYGGLEDE